MIDKFRLPTSDFRPIHPGTLLLVTLAAHGLVFASGLWMWNASDVPIVDPANPDLAVRRAQLRVDVIRNVLAVGAGTGGLIALILALRKQFVTERVNYDEKLLRLRTADATEHDADQRRFVDLYVKAAELLGNENASVRMAGIYALERLGQNRPSERQMVVDLICAYLRMPYRLPAEQNEPPSEDMASYLSEQARRRQELEVRLTAQRILQQHLTKETPQQQEWAYWQHIDVDLTGALLVNFKFSGCHVRSLDCRGATFHGAASFYLMSVSTTADFSYATFLDTADFRHSIFEGWFDFRATMVASPSTIDLDMAVANWANNDGKETPSYWSLVREQSCGIEPCGRFKINPRRYREQGNQRTLDE